MTLFVLRHPSIVRVVLIVVVLFLLHAVVHAASPETFYPTLDGYVEETGLLSSWSSVRGAGGDGASGNGADMLSQISTGASSANYDIFRRAEYVFDTAALDDDITITAAQLCGVTWLSPSSGLGQGKSVVVSSAPTGASPANGDYALFGTTAFSSATTNSTFANDASYHCFDLSSDGLAAISLTGTTKLGVRDENDRANSEPTFVTSADNYIAWKGSATTGTASDPKLVVTYTTPPPPPPDEIMLLLLSGVIGGLSLSFPFGGKMIGRWISGRENYINPRRFLRNLR